MLHKAMTSMVLYVKHIQWVDSHTYSLQLYSERPQFICINNSITVTMWNVAQSNDPYVKHIQLVDSHTQFKMIFREATIHLHP